MTIYTLSCKQSIEPFKAVWWWKEYPQFGMIQDALVHLLKDGVSNIEVASLLDNGRLVMNRDNNIYMFVLEEKEEGLL